MRANEMCEHRANRRNSEPRGSYGKRTELFWRINKKILFSFLVIVRMLFGIDGVGGDDNGRDKRCSMNGVRTTCVRACARGACERREYVKSSEPGNGPGQNA